VWQFLISGYVPGTEFQITFDTIAGILCVFLLVIALQTELKRSSSMQKQILKTSKAVHEFRKLSTH
jgi:hypothetical protein